VTVSDRIALGMTKFLRFFADAFFSKRYGHRAVVLERSPPCRHGRRHDETT